MQLDHVLAAIAEPQEPVQPVLERAKRIALAAGSDLVLFHAVFDSALSGRPFFDSTGLARSRGALVARRTRELERHARSLRQQGLKVDTHVVWEEPAYGAIIRAAIRESADLVIAGPHVRERTNVPFSLRQTDWELLRYCPKPLLMVRTSKVRRGPILVALDPTHANDKPASLDAALLDAASALAKPLDVALHAAHSVTDAAYPLGSSSKTQVAIREKARKKLQREVKKHGVPASKVHLLRGTPERTLPDIAAQLDAQLMVMGAISRRGLKRFVIGDTADRLIHSVPCDVLIVKPDKFKLVLGRNRREQIILP